MEYQRIKFIPLVDHDGVLTEDERRRIIARLHALLSWVGSSIPREEIIDGKKVDVREAVAEFISKKELTSEDLSKAQSLASLLLSKERDLEEKIARGDISEDKALELLEEARGLMRAVQELKNTRNKAEAEVNKEILMKKVDDEKRWQKFLEEVK